MTKRRNLWPLITSIAILACLVACGGMALALAKSSPPNSPGVTLGSEGAKAAKSAAPKKTNGIGPGTWRVGTDVKAGTYRTAGADGGLTMLCYWHTAKDSGTSRIIDQGTATESDQPGIVTLKAGQYFQTSGCKSWVKQ